MSPVVLAPAVPLIDPDPADPDTPFEFEPPLFDPFNPVEALDPLDPFAFGPALELEPALKPAPVEPLDPLSNPFPEI
jgi:hypothetical protein